MGRQMDREDIARHMGISREYFDALEKTGRFDMKVASETEVPAGGQEKDVRKARQTGRHFSVRLKTNTLSPEETLDRWYKTPVGEKRIKDNRTYMETMNESMGFPTEYRGDHHSRVDIQKHMRAEEKQNRKAEEFDKEQRNKNRR